ncbi:MAG: molybdenum cofactor guanylyltransferase MobA [Gammaproteobacteria bacterium]
MFETIETRTQITGLILAGGRAQRMGGQDKGLLPLAGQPLVAHVIAALAPQVCDIIINANRNAEAYSSQGYRVFADAVGGYCGPLAGIESGLGLAATPYLLCVPCDSPFLHVALGQRLYAALTEADAEIAVAHDGEWMQPVFALFTRGLRSPLSRFLASGGRKIDRWYAQHRLAIADFSDTPEAFVNLNTPEELAAAEDTMAGRQPAAAGAI